MSEYAQQKRGKDNETARQSTGRRSARGAVPEKSSGTIGDALNASPAVQRTAQLKSALNTGGPVAQLNGKLRFLRTVFGFPGFFKKTSKLALKPPVETALKKPVKQQLKPQLKQQPVQQEIQQLLDSRPFDPLAKLQLKPPLLTSKEDSSDSELEEEAPSLSKNETPSAGTMTVLAGEKRIKGNKLIALTDKTVKKMIDQIAGDDLPQYEEKTGARVVESGSDWVKTAGTGDKMISRGQRRPLHIGANFLSMEHPIAPRTGKVTGKLAVGKGRSMMHFNLRNKMVRVSPENGKDLEYKELATELNALRDKHKLKDPDIAKSLLTLIRSGELSGTNPLANDPEALRLLHFTNTLGLGVEGSRLNANFFYYPSMMNDIASGHFTLQEAFHQDPFGGLLPMATTGGINKKGILAERREELLKSDSEEVREKLRGKPKLMDKFSKKRRGWVGSMKEMRARLSENLVMNKEAQYLADLTRRLRNAEKIEDQATLEDALQRYIRETMLASFG